MTQRITKLINFLLTSLAFFIFISHSAFSNELITNPKLKVWIKYHKNQLPGVVINEDGGIDNTTANLEALAKIDSLDCNFYYLDTIDELIIHMSNLKTLICVDIALIELDLSNNTKLEKLICCRNKLTNLDLSKNVGLIYLDCTENLLTNLDISNNIELEILGCYKNKITNLDLSNNIKLEELYCNNNQLTRLDISPLPVLVKLNCCSQAEGFILCLTDEQRSKFTAEHYCNAILQSNKLITDPQLKEWIKLNTDKLPEVVVNEDGGIDNTIKNLEALAKIENLICPDFSLVTIDELIRHMPNLKKLECQNNSLIELDISKHIKLESLYCNNNQLASLDISLLSNLAELKCCNQAEGFILYLTNEQKSKFTEEEYCDAILYTEVVTDPQLKEWIKSNTHKFPGVVVSEDGRITGTPTNLEALAKIEYFQCSHTKLNSINELIRHMTNLNKLVCNSNSLIELDVSKNLELIELNCDMNDSLTNLDISKNVKLKSLRCSRNKLTDLDLSKNIELMLLGCVGNQLTDLDVSKNTELILLGCFENQLNGLDVTNNIKLIELYCAKSQLSNLDISKNIELTVLDCSENQLTNLDLANNLKLLGLGCFDNQLNSLDVTNNIKLKKLYCAKNQLINLDLSKNMELEELDCSENQLTNLDVSKNIELKILYCNDNILDSLDIRPLAKLEELKCCNQAEGFTLYLTKEQKNIFTEEDYCDAILKEKDGSICEIEWLDVYPNPTLGRFFIESKFISDEIKILNLAGEVLYRETLNAEKTEIDISNLPSGVYFVITKGKVGKVVKN